MADWNWRLLGAWALLGLCNNVGYVIMLSSAEDILAGRAGEVLAADIVPTLFAKSLAPWVAPYIPYRIRFAVCGGLSVVSYLLVALGTNTATRLTGVCFASLGSGWGETTALSYSGRFDAVAVPAWSSGTGLAGIVGAGWVLGFTSAGIHPSTTILTANIFAVLFLVASLVLMPAPDASGAAPFAAPLRESSAALVGQGGEEEALLHESEAEEDERSSAMGVEPPEAAMQQQQQQQHEVEASATPPQVSSSMLWPVLQRVWWVIACLSTVYFAEYTLSTGVVSTLGFHAVTKHRFYILASFSYQTGVFFSRTFATKLPVLPLHVLWPFPLLQLATLALGIIQATTNFIQSPTIMLLIIFWEGLLGGTTYVRSFAHVHASESPQTREFATGITSMSDSIGIVLASIVSTLLEPALDKYRAAHGFL